VQPRHDVDPVRVAHPRDQLAVQVQGFRVHY
jgi:hypothetical protein